MRQGTYQYQHAPNEQYDSAERCNRREERRVNHRKAVVHSLYRKRRSVVRRNSDELTGIYVDTHETSLWYLSLGLMVLCVLDAFFTTILIANGSEELNPILDYLLQIDLTVFLAVKFFITGASIVFLVLHKHHRFLNTFSCYQLLVASVAIYAILICYQLSMIRYIPNLF